MVSLQIGSPSNQASKGITAPTSEAPSTANNATALIAAETISAVTAPSAEAEPLSSKNVTSLQSKTADNGPKQYHDNAAFSDSTNVKAQEACKELKVNFGIGFTPPATATEETDAKPILNNFYAQRLRDKERNKLRSFFEKEIESLYSKIIAFKEPYLKEETAKIKKLIEEYRNLKFYKESVFEKLLVVVAVNAVSPPCAALTAGLYPFVDELRRRYIIFPLTAKKLATLSDAFWKDSNDYKTLSTSGKDFELQEDDEKRVKGLSFKIRRIAIAGKIMELDQKNEKNVILKVFSEFVKFKKEDLKQLSCTSSEKQYYHDGTECHIYKNILEKHKKQWADSIIDIMESNSFIDIIKEVAKHTRYQQADDAEVEEFPGYCAPEIPQEVDADFKSEIEGQFVIL